MDVQLTETCYSASCGQSGGAERTVSSDSQLGVVLGDRRATRRPLLLTCGMCADELRNFETSEMQQRSVSVPVESRRLSCV
ncbi:hypothetical protein T492DRAFT_88080 [Pavlovales sp. CCMP2436]|nr:hypothetical protein T492DRAFT_88080 [Pavlovales sp. CCMP2436]